MVKIVVKHLDKLGRIVIPKDWRKKIGDTVILVWDGEIIKVIPIKNFKLTDVFDSIEFSGGLEEWTNVKRMKKRLLNEILWPLM